MIQVKSLSASYGSEAILKDINLNLESGKVYGLVGKNGAGKTTLFDCLAGLKSHEGSITYEGQRLKEITGYLATRPYMMSHITAYEYLQLMSNARKQTAPDWDTGNLFELPLKQYASQYSTGMQKKLALTALLHLKNQFFLLDEPFNGLDLESNLMLAAVIKKLKEANKTVLISSHILATLAESCDLIHLLDEGRIIKSYEPQEYKELNAQLATSEGLARIEAMRF